MAEPDPQAPPVVFTMIGLAPDARFAPPKFPEPESTRVSLAVPPAVTLGMIPQASTHFAFPSGQVSVMRNWPAVLEVNDKTEALRNPAESAIGTPVHQGAFVREIPPGLVYVCPVRSPGYKAS